MELRCDLPYTAHPHVNQPLAVTQDQPRRAALFVLSSALLFALMGGFIKYLSQQLPVEMVVFFRNLFGLLVLLPWLLHGGVRNLRTHHLRLHLARSLFEDGRNYLSQVESWRARLAGYAYMARFEGVLDAIEREDYLVRAAYPERKSLLSGMKMSWFAVTQAFNQSYPPELP